MMHSPEQSLWQEVLFRQVDDALNGPSSLDSGSKQERIAVCLEARRYLTTPSCQLAQLCALAGINPDALIERMRAKIANAPTPEALSKSRKRNRAALSATANPTRSRRVRLEDRQYTARGETLTLAKWAERTGNSVQTIASRINEGWSVERAIMQPKGRRQRTSWGFTGSTQTLRQHPKQRRKRAPNASARRITHDGLSLTIAQWSERTGINKTTIDKRLRNGWPASRVLAPVNHRNKSMADTDRPGVVSVFETEQGTGGGRSAQDSPKIDFPIEGIKT